MSYSSVLDCFETVLLDENVVAACKEAGKRARDEFIERAALQAPTVIRLVDCKASSEEGQIVIVDYGDRQKEVGYSAISHTYGKEVYGVFDCECAAKCLASVPRRSNLPCPRHATRSPRNRIVSDFLNMCKILYSEGVQYIWHDGACIAQHDQAELYETTQCMGWIYANANETIIFLHYFGKPMAPIRHNADRRRGDPLISRWHSRVWTLQEGAISRYRRYCIRKGESLARCQSVEEFEEKLASWYNDDTSTIAVVDEDAYWEIIKEFYTVILRLYGLQLYVDRDLRIKIEKWLNCINNWVSTMVYTCLLFPTIGVALEFCSLRHSKHAGDRINSILALAGVKDFVAPRDINVEDSTITFFRKQGQQGFARAVFSANIRMKMSSTKSVQHSWLPILTKPYASVYESGINIYTQKVRSSDVEKFITFTLDNMTGNMKLEGKLACLAVKFTIPKTGAHSSEGFGQQDINPAILQMHLMDDMKAHGFSASLAMDIGILCPDEYTFEKFRKYYLIVRFLNLWNHVRVVFRKRLATALRVFHDNQNSRPARELSNAVKTILLSFRTLPASLELGRAIIPRPSRYDLHGQEIKSTDDFTGPVIKGEEIRAGCSFSCYLAFPLQPLQRHKEFTELYPSAHIPQLDWTLPGLLIQGDIFSTEPLHKIGCFHLNKQLKNILALLLPSLTMIQQLVIR